MLHTITGFGSNITHLIQNLLNAVVIPTCFSLEMPVLRSQAKSMKRMSSDLVKLKNLKKKKGCICR